MAFLGVSILVCLNALVSKPAYAQTCSAQDIDPGQSTKVTVRNSAYPNTEVIVQIICPQGKTCSGGNWNANKIHYCTEFPKTDAGGVTSGTISGPFSVEGMYRIVTYVKGPGPCSAGSALPLVCQGSFCVGQECESTKYDICQGDLSDRCEPCVTAGNAWTAIGCITTSDPQEFVIWLLKAGIGIAGGIALLLMIMGGILIILSSGDPQKLQSGKDILTSAILGLVVIIFSVFLLQLIGVQILMIPGFR